MLPRLKQFYRIDVGANNLRIREIAGKRDTFLACRTSEREDALCVRCSSSSGSKNLRVSVQRGPVRTLVATGMKRSDKPREVEAPDPAKKTLRCLVDLTMTKVGSGDNWSSLIHTISDRPNYLSGGRATGSA